MIRFGIAAAVALAAAIGFFFMPTTAGSGLRRAVAVKAVQADMPALGVALLAPLADAGDAGAQNNLAVLLNRGIGTTRDPAKAAFLFNAAASAGLARAQMNLVLLRTPCDTQYVLQTTAKLEGFARAGDRRAASFLADCLSWSTSAFPFAEGTRHLLDAAAIATSTADPDEELKFGWLLMQRTKQAEGWGADQVRRDSAQAAARYLLRAAAHGRPAAYEGLSLLRLNANSLLSGPEAGKVSEKQPAEWIDIAAREGHPKSRCSVGTKLATEIAQRPATVAEAEKTRYSEYFYACAKGHNPRQVIFKDGKEQTLGHDPLFDIWMREDIFLVMSPRYENYDYDNVTRDDAMVKMTRAMSARR